ncbi:MAG TPA: hypothetical protein DCZ95_02875 [Verrucomicrobia bacterium]|nr:hypothetical protein [Verrucomicrobiota bacterium]
MASAKAYCRREASAEKAAAVKSVLRFALAVVLDGQGGRSNGMKQRDLNPAAARQACVWALTSSAMVEFSAKPNPSGDNFFLDP